VGSPPPPRGSPAAARRRSGAGGAGQLSEEPAPLERREEGSATRSVAWNTAIQTVGKALVLVIGAASIALLTRYLGPTEYGKYSLALAYLQLFGVLADVGLYTLVVREISKQPERTQELVANTLVLRLVLSLAVVVLASGISLLMPYDRDTRLAILIAGVPLVLGLLNSSLVAVFQARLRMDRAVISETVGRAATFAAAVAVVALDLGFYAVVATAAIGAFVTLVVTAALARRFVSLRLRADRLLWRRLLLTSVPLGLAIAVNDLYVRADTFIISLFRPFDEVGLYALSWRILEVTTTLPLILLTTVFPLLSRYVVEDLARARRAMQTTFGVLAILGVPLAISGFMLAPQVIELVAGSEFEDAGVPLSLLLVSGALSFVNGLFGFSLIAADRQLDVLRVNLSGLACNVALNLALVPPLGIDAAAASAIASEAIIMGGYLVLVRRRLQFVPRLLVVGRALAAATVMAVPLVLLRGQELWLLAPLALLVYGAALHAFGGIDRSLVERLRTGA
jgi:O-antigen/teichoic acid export membrane protein